MNDGYDPKSCNASEKLFYTILEAAIRWCNLFAHESKILSKMGNNVIPDVNMFPEWGCLRENALKLLHATNQGQLAYGRDGKTVPKGEHVSHNRLTIQNSALKAWMTEYYPGQKPAFLFDEIERTIHTSINTDVLIALQADRDELKTRIQNDTNKFNTLKEQYNTMEEERDLLQKDVNRLKTALKATGVPDERSETIYLTIIAIFLESIKGEGAFKTKRALFSSEAQLITAFVENYGKLHGISKSNLESKFPQAKKILKNILEEEN